LLPRRVERAEAHAHGAFDLRPSYTVRLTAERNDDLDAAAPDRHAATILVENHRAFLRYLERRMGNRALAEDLLQDAFVRNLDRLSSVSEEGLVPWFYRVLRNAAIDRHRRYATEVRALAAFSRELSDASVPAADMRQEICACVGRLAQTLKPEYAEALKAVDIDATPVKAFAAAAGLTPSNAGVRLFRAREALRRQVTASCGTCAEHGCVDCSCGKAQ
jgi:RNA polymerase sigma-70 factor (ECF subfamily)